MRKSKLKRTMSMLLTVLMVFMSMNFSVFAEELTAPAGETTNSVEVPAEQSADEPEPAVVAPTPVDEETGTTEENATDNSLRQERPALLQAPVPNGTGIAKIDDQEYTDQATFLTAFNAMTGSHTVQLLEDIDLGNIATNNAAGHATANDIFTVQKDADITLDLNGHKITGALKSNGSNYGQEYIIGNFGTLTIQDASSAKTGVIENTTNTQECLATLRNQYDANLTIEGGTIKATIGNAISNYGKAIVYSGTIQTTAEKAGGWENGSAAIHNRGSLTIAKKDSLPEPIVSTSNGIPVWVSSTSDGRSIGNAKISAGTYTTKTSDVDVKIESGAADASIVIEGGIWDKDPSAYVGAPYVVEKKDSKYSVRYGYDGEKNVSSYSELENALKSVGSNWVDIKLSENITVTGDITIPEKAKVIIPEGKKLILSKDRKLELKGKLENNGILDISQIGNGWVNDISHLFGSGTIEGLPVSEAGVYKISTINQFQFMHYVLMNGKGSFTGTIELQKDIDAANYNFVALGDYTNNFAGNFNGNNKVLKNLTINSVSGNGSIFNGVENASFLNLNIENCNIQTTNGMLGLLAAATEGNIIVKDVIISGSMRNATSYYSGGLIGTLGNGTYTFENCNLRLSINGFQNVGTFWGSAQNRTATINIINCSNSGDISSTGSYGTIGGFGYGPVTVNVFGYNYTGVITVKGQKIDTPKLCTKSESDQFIIAAAREKTEDKQYKYYETIEEAVANAADNAVIEIAPGTYNLSSTLRVNKPLTLKGLGDVIITRGDAWTPKDEQATDSETGSLILIEKTNDVTLENLTVQGARKITGSVTANGHGINIVQAENVTLNNVTSKDNAAAGIVVNGSIVTAGGLYTSGNGWYGMNVDQGSGITDETIFTLDTAQPNKLSERLQIVSDKFATSDNIYVYADGFAQRSYKAEDGHEVVYWVDEATLIKNTTKNITYTTIQEAIDGATRGNTIEIPAGIYSDTLDINKSGLNLKKAAGDGDCVLDGTIAISSKNVNIQDIKAGDNAKVAVKKDASLILKNATGFDTDKKITVEKLFGEAYDTGMVKLDGIGVAKDKLDFTYLGEEIKPDINLFKANEVSYTVKTPAQFYWLSQQINEGKINTSNVTIKLGNDLDFHNDEWMPVGVANHDYIGKFDGQSHKISNLLVNMPGKKYIGLFGKAWGAKELGNVDFENVNIIGGQYAGTLAGQLGSATVKNVNVNNFVFKTGKFTGGIVGSGYSNISNCKVQSGSIATEDQNVGGILGFLGEGNFTIQNCHSDQITISEPSWDAGGLIGATVYGNVKVYNCSVKNSTITITASGWFESYDSYRGELIGEMRGSKTYEANLYLYNCNSVDTTAINKNVPGDQSQLVGGNQDYIKTLTVYNENNKTPYATINEAVKEANSGDTITIGAGTYNETVTLDKAVNLVGPYADTPIKAADVNAENRPEATEAVITGGINITRTTKDANSISIKGLKFTKSGIYSVGWGNDPNLDSITIENNVFENIANELNNREKSVSAIHFNLADSQPVQNCTIKNNRISGVANGDSSGINVFVVSGETEITGNYIENTNHSALQIPGTAKGNVTITGNTFKNWDQDIANGGRAMRFGDFSGVESLTVTGNKMIRTLALGDDKDQMAKFDAIPSTGSLDFSLNYWNGKLPVTTYGTAVDNSVIVVSEGGAKVNAVPYYTDEAMTATRVPATVYGTDGQEKGQYLTIQEAVNAAETGDRIVIDEGVYSLTTSITIPENKDLTIEGKTGTNGESLTTLQRDAAGDGNSIIISAANADIKTTVKNLNFVTTKDGTTPFYYSGKTAELTIEGCTFNAAEGVTYGGNLVMGAGDNTGKLSFINNKVNLSFRNAINGAGNGSVITENAFEYTSDRIDDTSRTSVISLVADDNSDMITITDNIFKNANRAIAVDNSPNLKADKLTIKNNQFIDVRYGFELGSEKNKTCGTYDLSKNYYAQTDAEGTETVSAMLVEDADKSGSHFDDLSLYTGNQVKVYPYYIDREMTKIYAPVEVQHKGTATASEYFGTIADAYAAETTLEGDTIIVSQNADGTPVTITEDIDMGLKNVNLELVGDTTFNGSFAGSTRANLVVQNGSAITFTKAEKEAIQYYTTVDVKNFDATNPTTIVAPAASTSQNSFIAKGGLMAFSTDGTTNTWIYSSPSDRFNGGDGTAEKPWQINTPEQMKLLQTPAFETNGKFFKLTNDITVDNWTALASFAGNFDGNGYTITGNNVNFIDELAEGAKVEKLRFEGFSNLVNTNNGTVENCWTVGGQTTSIVNIMGKTGKLTDSFTAGAMAVQTNEARGAVLRVYHCGETGGIGTAMTKADMQKARFANSLNGEKEGVWGYSTADGDSAYPFVIKDGGKTTIQPITVTVTPDKTNADPAGYAELLTQGKIYANDEVKVQATLKDSEHYVFSSWTVNDVTADARTAVATIKVKDANTVIKANFTDKPKVMLNVTPVGAGAVYLSINDGAEQKLTTNTYVQEVYIGSKVTVRAEGYNIPNVFTTVFRYWIDANTGQNLSSDSSYTINSIGTPRVLQAVFEEKEQDSYKVQFNDINGKELTSGYYKTTDTINVPAAPIVFGYEFVQWKGDDGSVIDKDTKTITGIKADTAYRAIYRTVSVKYTIKVTDGTIDGKTSAEAEQRTNVTAVANKAPDGKVFVGWQEVVDGVPTGIYLSYSESYTFSVTRNMTIQAIYENSKPIETVRVMLDPTPIITKTSEAPEVYKASFLLELNVPEGYTVVETGFVYKTGEVQNIDELEINKENVIKKAAPFVPKAQFSMGVKNLEKPFVITARAYAILDNGTIMYSDNTAEAKLQ
ncbi:InlB B-repeat-containing protein [Eubacterium maltosivorans]|uniref:InlB B-repeat-containing protein n=1 Tax=Eubacterium maltosivorans TaxID=2041044 RepID=UPI003A91BB22